MEWKYALVFDSKEDLDKAVAKLGGNPESQKKIDSGMLTCSDCKKTIPEVVASYSKKWYGEHLCRECQLLHQKKEGSP